LVGDVGCGVLLGVCVGVFGRFEFELVGVGIVVLLGWLLVIVVEV